MTNKEKLRKAIEQDIDSKSYYNEIINKIEKEDNPKRNTICKWTLVPICLVIIISGIVFLNYPNNSKPILKNTTYKDKENNIKLNINEITNYNSETSKLDADIKVVTGNDINFPLPYQSANIPKDLNKNYKYIVYTRNNKEIKEYNIINNYIIGYTDDNDRNIEVSYSKEHKPLRDYYFSDEESNITTINGIELKIYKCNNTFYTKFKHNGYNIDIETTKITEQELSTFLSSILK